MPAVIRQPVESETAAVRRMWEECFPETSPPFVQWYFSRVYRPEYTIGLFEGGALASNLQMIPYTLSLRGRSVLTQTLSGVATGAAYRNRGYAKALMAEALVAMAGRRIGFTFLYPFNHEFYKRLGWETCSLALEYARPADELPAALPDGWSVRAADRPDSAVLAHIYDAFMAGRNCRCLRGESQWRRRLEENGANGGFALLAEYRGAPAAYALCELTAEGIELTELAHTRAEAVQAILAALKPRGRNVVWTAPADDPALLLSGPWKDRVKLQPHVMFRVTDIGLAFAQAAPAVVGSAIVEISGDNLAPGNNGRYLVTAEAGAAHAERTEREPQFCCGPGTLARILTGFIDAGEAVRAGLAQGDDAAVTLLTAMYPRQSNFLFELY